MLKWLNPAPFRVYNSLGTRQTRKEAITTQCIQYCYRMLSQYSQSRIRLCVVVTLTQTLLSSRQNWCYSKPESETKDFKRKSKPIIHQLQLFTNIYISTFLFGSRILKPELSNSMFCHAASLQPKVITSKYMNRNLHLSLKALWKCWKPQYKKEWTQIQCG